MITHQPPKIILHRHRESCCKLIGEYCYQRILKKTKKINKLGQEIVWLES